jgi:hypothetical protein
MSVYLPPILSVFPLCLSVCQSSFVLNLPPFCVCLSDFYVFCLPSMSFCLSPISAFQSPMSVCLSTIFCISIYLLNICHSASYVICHMFICLPYIPFFWLIFLFVCLIWLSLCLLLQSVCFPCLPSMPVSLLALSVCLHTIAPQRFIGQHYNGARYSVENRYMCGAQETWHTH